ncbi:Peptide-N4-(N-acetyl-beta-glucosaminyl)asparagine amidase A [Lasiodiplodia theobromae]|uniref:Peptide-N4-(N-acetyl-beta-glucosaminyl)asparagine amidase A n=1 Tax=Lasiodiplodia theobromae TaxID=45133 RepID=A0A5N5DMD6_9PEZI|nr:Peptide-N4-(N-acetyl-beta-glucosaminyl)asparagine amidase A [Lasiodiplodia theobromae]KAB2578907.1 Peptide-N4-(N-acetyl-beta-glucosaminyl)asparagine amidase A [Lasiodiplodia theobromae]KAF4546405.1 Peptide-N4-(N-acetyl-beta-glucosaminyl)asparagine amidase A [Lasiodiplodia theobromae]KAF9630543.1 Peptide-N4-(N-acetyl-beta-glucosaminyl)asparagine amidase A [Lasiodiplodia theobromae]
MGSPPSAAVPTAHALPNHASAGRLSRLSGMRIHDMHEHPPAHWPGAPRSRAVLPVAALIAFARVLVSVLLLAALALPTASANRAPAGPRELAVRADNASSQLAVLEVDPPVLVPPQPACQQTLMVHVFAYSYGTPFVGTYVPPACDFNRATFNLTVTSRGRQFDRLALMYFNDTEIFRTSTAEPTTNGIRWTYIKDMSAFVPLLREPQKIIFDLGNLIDDTYTGSFNTTLTASFYADPESSFAPADVVLPVSARRSSTDGASAFNLPADNATNALSLPRNVERAIFSISANGQSTEEFWWANVLSSDVSAFGSETTLYGFSPWREVQLYIDGVLAGVVWPFPIIFTGGVAPGFWRPIVGIDAFDLKEDQIDITPWLPLLCDGLDHSFEIRVTGLNDTGSGEATPSGIVGSYWVVTGKLFLWLSGNESAVTTGTAPRVLAPAPSISVSSIARGLGANGTNATLDYAVAVSRHFSVSSTVVTSAGASNVSWTQTLAFSNIGNFSDAGNVQVTNQKTTGLDRAAIDKLSSTFERTYSYPLWAYTAYAEAGSNFSIDAALDRGKYVSTIGVSAFPLGIEDYNTSATGTILTDRQNGTATYLSVSSPSSQSFSSGTTEQDLTFAAANNLQGEGEELLYKRHIVASNGTVVRDDEGLYGNGGRIKTETSWMSPVGVTQEVLVKGYGSKSVQEVLGRGPRAVSHSLSSVGLASELR